VRERSLCAPFERRNPESLKWLRLHDRNWLWSLARYQNSLILELDGDSHIGRHEYDMERQKKLVGAGYRVLRFGNDDVLRDLDAVLGAILLACGRSA
jgi:very-short-patch-repair endonuclease